MADRRWRAVAAFLVVMTAVALWVGAYQTRPGAFIGPLTWRSAQASLSILAWGLTGILLWGRPQTRRMGGLMVLTAIAIALSRLIDSNVAVLFTLGLALQWLTFPVQLWAILGYPQGRLGSRRDRVAVGALFAVAVMHGLGAGTMYEPTLHWDWCTECVPGMNLLLLSPVESVVDGSYRVLITIIGAGGAYGAAVTILRWLRSNPLARRVRGPMLLPAIVYLCFVAFFHFYDLAGQLGATLPVPLPSLGTVGWFAMLMLPVTFLIGLLRSHARRGRVADLVTQLHQTPSTDRLEESLRRTLGDPSLELVHLAPGMAIPADPVRATTVIEGDSGPLAALVHDPALLEERRLLEATTAAARLAIENAHLAAELRGQLAEVRASRTRIVQAADEARRTVERDLHDGAQQRLVTLSLLLRQASRQYDNPPLLTEAITHLDSALGELRDLARGVYPLALAEGGLAAALDGLAERSPVPTFVVDAPEERLPDSVEAAAYFVASEAVTNAAKHAAAATVHVLAQRSNGTLVVEVRDDGIGGAAAQPGGGLHGLQDRVDALDGLLIITSEPGGGTIVRTELPCASS